MSLFVWNNFASTLTFYRRDDQSLLGGTRERFLMQKPASVAIKMRRGFRLYIVHYRGRSIGHDDYSFKVIALLQAAVSKKTPVVHVTVGRR